MTDPTEPRAITSSAPGSEARPTGSKVGVVLYAIIAVVAVFLGLLAYLVGRHYYVIDRTAEPKNTMGAIARAVIAAYERGSTSSASPAESTAHRLCGTATPVPSAVPRGARYVASRGGKKDYETGDVDNGWICLRFEDPFATYFQYDYRAYGGYKGPARGGPDPGPDGFEISAEGDLNGDGKTSLFTMTGKVDPTTHTIHLDEAIFASSPEE